MELADNLWWIERPDIPGISYDFDGPGTIYNANYEKTSSAFLLLDLITHTYMLMVMIWTIFLITTLN